MSYILEALRKAERERNLGQVPTLAGLPDANPPPPRRLWPWMLAAALAANVLVAVLIYLFPRQDAHLPAVETLPPPPVAALPPAESLPAESMNPPVDEVTQPVLDEMPAEELPVEPAPVRPIRAQPRRQTPVDAYSGSEVEQPQSTQEAPAEEAALPVEEEPVPAQRASGGENVPTLRDMPPDFRRSVQAIRIDAHFYSEDPARRFVMINLRKYHEGERLLEGPELERIEQDGLLLSYQGQRFRMPLPR